MFLSERLDVYSKASRPLFDDPERMSITPESESFCNFSNGFLRRFVFRRKVGETKGCLDVNVAVCVCRKRATNLCKVRGSEWR